MNEEISVLKRRSKDVTDGLSRMGFRSFLCADGLTREDIKRPLIALWKQ